MKILRYRDHCGTIHHACELPDGSFEVLEGIPWSDWTPSGRKADVREILAPLDPVAILCIGLNYRRHAEETGARIPQFPVLFCKNPAAVQAPSQPVEIPTFLASHQVDYECELAVVIGKPCKNATPENALDFVAGYTCANDVSARDWQKDFGGSQWCRGKSFDTFCPLGPRLVTPEEIPNPNALQIRTFLNGEIMQDSNSSDMIFSVAEIIAFLSGSTTLLPGTVILTGTPEGVGMARKPPVWLKSGDEVAVEIEGIGRLTNPVVHEP